MTRMTRHHWIATLKKTAERRKRGVTKHTCHGVEFVDGGLVIDIHSIKDELQHLTSRTEMLVDMIDRLVDEAHQDMMNCEACRNPDD